MQPNPIAPQLSIMAKGSTAKAWNIQLTHSSIRKTRVNLATKLTKRASSKNRLCSSSPSNAAGAFISSPRKHSVILQKPHTPATVRYLGLIGGCWRAKFRSHFALRSQGAGAVYRYCN
jgi:hypothetical protein